MNIGVLTVPHGDEPIEDVSSRAAFETPPGGAYWTE